MLKTDIFIRKEIGKDGTEYIVVEDKDGETFYEFDLELPSHILRNLKGMAKKRKISVNDLVIDIMLEEMNNMEKKKREGNQMRDYLEKFSGKDK